MSWMSCLLCVLSIYKDITIYCTVKELVLAVQFLFSKVSVQSVTVNMSLSKIVLSLDLGGTRRLQILENNEVLIKDLDNKKCTFFTPPRWKCFVGLIDDIEEQIQLSLVGKPINYIQHIGGTWHVSVNDKFPTVDIRRWYEDSRTEFKPTRVGIALTHPNWYKLLTAIVEVENEIPAMLAITLVMKRIRFSTNNTVYVADNYDRTSPWEIIARDRMRFKRRIEITEKLLSPILTELHRDVIRLKRFSVNRH